MYKAGSRPGESVQHNDRGAGGRHPAQGEGDLGVDSRHPCQCRGLLGQQWGTNCHQGHLSRMQTARTVYTTTVPHLSWDPCQDGTRCGVGLPGSFLTRMASRADSRLVLSQHCPSAGDRTTGKVCRVSPVCPKLISLPKKPERTDCARLCVGVGAAPAPHGKWGKQPVFPRAQDFSGQHVTARPNLKNNIGMTFLRIFIHVLTGLYGLTRFVFPKENK